MGATVRNASTYMNRLKMNEEREKMARAILAKMSIEQLSDMVSFYHKMGQLCSEALDKKFNDMKDNIKMLKETTTANYMTIQLQDA